MNRILLLAVLLSQVFEMYGQDKIGSLEIVNRLDSEQYSSGQLQSFQIFKVELSKAIDVLSNKETSRFEVILSLGDKEIPPYLEIIYCLRNIELQEMGRKWMNY